MRAYLELNPSYYNEPTGALWAFACSQKSKSTSRHKSNKGHSYTERVFGRPSNAPVSFKSRPILNDVPLTVLDQLKPPAS